MNQTDQAPVEPEIRAERDYLDACRAALARMREEVSTMLANGVGEGDAVLDKFHNHLLRQMRTKEVRELADLDDVPLFFGRLDYPPGAVYDRGGTSRADGSSSPTHAPNRDLVYVGRRGVRDETGEPMVVDWRASLARAFYEASQEEPMGVRLRRRYGFDHNGTLTAYEDEPVNRAPAGSSGDLLAAEIERPRKGPMRDIVATIQPEQMSLVRAPLDRTLCVQGAPGTGKTAVGLHRLAYLLYAERERLRKNGGVAVIGPNKTFLSYIRNVLPALGEVEVSQTTIDALNGSGIAAEHADDPLPARIKGDARMAEVIRRHLWSLIRPPTESVEAKYRHRTWRLEPEELADELDSVLSRGVDYCAGRTLVAQRLAHSVLRQIERSAVSGTAPTLHQLQRNKAISRAVKQMWPTADPARLIFDLLTDREQLGRAADGILSADEQRAILLTPRPRSLKAMTWSTDDLALLDEAASLIERPAKLGHLVVDEAQDLSPMQIREIARRMAGSCTVLGDLAQATSPSAVQDWDSVLAYLDRPDGRVEELTRGYRVPAQVIDYAARLLPHIAPELSGPSSFRKSADALHITRTTPAEINASIVSTCAGASAQEGSVGLIAAADDIAGLHRTLSRNEIPHTVLGTDTTSLQDHRLTLSPVTLAKGLEFDTVVVVEPAHIAQAERRGLQHLYVALTRAVSSLRIIYAEDLPEPLTQETAMMS